MSATITGERSETSTGVSDSASPYYGVQAATWAMGTLVTQQAFGERAGEARAAAEGEISRLEGLLSRFRTTSDVGELNRRAGSGAVRVSPETFEVLESAVEFSAMSEGRFDVTIGPLVAAWQRGKTHGHAPAAPEIERALALVDWRDLDLDARERTARLRRRGQWVDLGGIGKGYAADRVLDVYREHGVDSAFVNLGGNVAALGRKPDGTPWRVGIQHPRREGELLGLVCVDDVSVVTSGDYERGFVDAEGTFHHHILEPSTGYPARSGLSSVTVVASNSMAADALSTAVFLAGRERGVALLERCPGVEAVLVDEASCVYLSAGLEPSFQAAEGVDVVVMGAKEMS